MELHIENLHKQAVDAALANNWDKAIQLNEKIISIDEGFLDAYLGLGFAHMQLNQMKESKKNYQEALKIDPNNIIARNNLEKVSILSKSGDQKEKATAFDPNIFMNIRGRTKVVSLINIGKPDILAKLHVGEKVEMRIKKRRIEIRDPDDEYVGVLPDDISKRIMFFLDGKCTFNTFIKAATKNSVDIFIREEKKGRKVKNFVSFPENIQDDLKMIIGKAHEDDEKDDNEEVETEGHELEPESDQMLGYDSLEEFDRNEKDEDTYFSQLQEDDDDDDFDE